MMRVQFGLVVLAACVALVYGICSVGLGKRDPHESQLYVLHARKDPVLEPQNMTLVFDYKVSPVNAEELTYVYVDVSSSAGCVLIFPGIANDLKQGFNIIVASANPVTEMSGTTTVYGIRRGN